MQFNNVKSLIFTVILLGCTLAFAQNNKATVEELLKIDNSRALEKAKADAAKELEINNKNVVKPTVSPKPVEIPQQWAIRAIYGSAERIYVDVIVFGNTYSAIKPGDSVNGCSVTSIENRCITSISAKPLGPKAFDSCPKIVCWTGDELSSELQPSQSPGTNKSDNLARPLQIPVPALSK